MIVKNKISILVILITLINVFNGGNQKVLPITEGKRDSQTQQILSNNKFLNSSEGMDYQKSAWYFTKAFLNGDLEYIKDNLVDPNELEDYGYKNQFSKAEYMIYRIYDYDDKAKTVYGEYIIQINKDDGCIYLEFRMILDKDGEWKIVNYSLDA